MRLQTLILLISSVCFGATNYIDFAVVADGWLTTHGMPELRACAADWLNYDPDATGGAVAVNLNTLTEITFDGQFNEQFIIDTMPTKGVLYDIFHTNYMTGKIKFAEVRSVPHTVKHKADSVYYYSTDLTADGFTFKAGNRKDSRQSSTATVTITKTANDKDSLFYDRSSMVIIPDANDIEFDDSFTFACWFKPMARHGTIIEKRNGGAGVKISIRAKHLVVEAWNSSGDYGKVIFDNGIDELWLDSWHFLAVTKDVTDTSLDSIYLDAASVDASTLPVPPYTNDADLVIGSAFLGEVDKLTWLDAKDWFSIATIRIETRTDYNGVMAPTDYLAQFRCDEGTGTTITDHVSGTLAGTITQAAWVPDDRPKRRNMNR